MAKIQIDGVAGNTFQIGVANAGPILKNVSGALHIRNATDTAHAQLLGDITLVGAATTTNLDCIFTSGVLNTTPEYGALEVASNLLYVTYQYNSTNYRGTVIPSAIGVPGTSGYIPVSSTLGLTVPFDGSSLNGAGFISINPGTTTGSLFVRTSGTSAFNYATYVTTYNSTANSADKSTIVSWSGATYAMGTVIGSGQPSATSATSVRMGRDVYVGSYSVSVGYLAGYGTVSGDTNNVNIGYMARSTGSNAVSIGNQIGSPGTGSIWFGAKNTYTSFNCYAAYVGTVGATRRSLYADVSGVIGYLPSALKYKENIVDYVDDVVDSLRPVTFDYKAPKVGIGRVGMIAEEVVQVVPGAVSYEHFDKEAEPDRVAEPEMINYTYLVPVLISTLKALKASVEEVEERILALERV
jgi:hypothetical protein